MNTHTRADRDSSFVIGLFTGAVVGAGLAMWLAPHSASELRERFTRTARRVGQQASEHYREASTRLGEAVDELARHGGDLRDDVAETVARGAHELERFAVAAKSDRVAEATGNPAAGEPAPKADSL
jgi:gas vesicle protein